MRCSRALSPAGFRSVSCGKTCHPSTDTSRRCGICLQRAHFSPSRRPYTVISRAMRIHTTVSESVPTLLQPLKPMT
jgi:hypothetical protein